MIDIQHLAQRFIQFNSVQGAVAGLVVSARVDYMSYQASKANGTQAQFFTTFNWPVARKRYLHGAAVGFGFGLLTDIGGYLGISNLLLGVPSNHIAT